jgi:3-isopropylmalate/(R)-2-methylmalate dehydratase small subunit
MAEPFTIVRGGAVPLLRNNVDTDTIAPGSPPVRKAAAETQFSEKGSSTLADDLFANWRYDSEGNPKPEFILNQPRFQGAEILLSGANFGCGSSRESAAWMLRAWGIRCIVAPSFAEIFTGNCYANGMLPLVLSDVEVNELAQEAEQGGAAAQFVVDLESCVLTAPSGRLITFKIAEFRRQGLLLGLDEIEVTLRSTGEIDQFVNVGRVQRPWLYPTPGDS